MSRRKSSRINRKNFWISLKRRFVKSKIKWINFRIKWNERLPKNLSMLQIVLLALIIH